MACEIVSLGGAAPVFGQLEENKNSGVKPSYLMVKAGTWGEDAAQLHRFFGWNNIGVSFQNFLFIVTVINVF